MIPVAKVALALCLGMFKVEPSKEEMEICVEIMSKVAEKCKPNHIPVNIRFHSDRIEFQCAPVKTKKA